MKVHYYISAINNYVHAFTGDKKEGYVLLDKILVSFGDPEESTFPVRGDKVHVYGTSFNLTLKEAYRKVVEMIFNGNFGFYGNRRFKVYDL